ncbi:MAG: sensor histidine kinase [Nocardioides sp.]
MDRHADAPPRLAARQAGLILLVIAAFTLTAPLTSTRPLSDVLVISLVEAGVAAVAMAAPWDTWGRRSTLGLAVAAFVLLGATAWVFDGYASGIGPLVVLVFAWLGLHHSGRAILAVTPVAAAAYAVGLVAADARLRLVLSVLVVIPVAVLVGLLIHQRVAELRATDGLLRSKDRWRAALMATLAHDVRSPLTSVTGVLEVLEDDPATPERYRGLLASAQRQAARILRLAIGMLEVERSEHGMLRLDRTDTRLAALAQDVAHLTEPEAVRVDIHADLTAHVDGARIEQVLYNLTNNALRHGEAPVVISAASDDDGVTLTVRDHGSGVPESEVPRLFDRFSSADHSPHSVGLGLWIVKTLTEAHDGTVTYEAAEPGASFVVRLPAED